MASRLPKNEAPIRFPSQRELLTAILRRWKLVVLCALLGFAWGVNTVHYEPYLYTIQMTVTPAQRAASSNVGGGLAALVNLALPAGSDTGSDFSLYLDLLKSRNIADELAKDPKLMHTMYAGYWDERTQTWHDVPDTRRWVVAQKQLLEFLGYPPVQWHEPDGETVLDFLSLINVEQDPRRPYMARIFINHGDKQFAMQFLSRLHNTADSMLRERAIKRTNDYIAYLSSTLAKVTVAEHRLALAQALSEQEKAAMIAKSGAPFAAEVLEEPWAKSYPSFPQAFQTLSRWTIVGALIGGVLALLFWLVRTRWDARMERRSRRLALASGSALADQSAAEAKAA